MAVLHIVKHSPCAARTLQQCLARVGEGDSVLLIEDAVYALVQDGPAHWGCRVYALQPDLAARGLLQQPRRDDVEIVDYAGFVQLAVQHSQVLSWN